MNYLFFDTETTGLPHNYKAHFTDIHNWPRVVQLAWMLTDEDGKVLMQRCDIIKPEGYTIPEKMIHGITQEQSEAEGGDKAVIYEMFIDVLNSTHTIVAHNIGFDLPIVSAELIRLGREDVAKALNRKIKQQCTQAIGTNYCKIPNKNGYANYKWPRLSELHEKLFGEGFDGAHDAMNDVKATARCFFELKRLGLVYA